MSMNLLSAVCRAQVHKIQFGKEEVAGEVTKGKRPGNEEIEEAREGMTEEER